MQNEVEFLSSVEKGIILTKIEPPQKILLRGWESLMLLYIWSWQEWIQGVERVTSHLPFWANTKEKYKQATS